MNDPQTEPQSVADDRLVEADADSGANASAASATPEAITPSASPMIESTASPGSTDPSNGLQGTEAARPDALVSERSAPDAIQPETLSPDGMGSDATLQPLIDLAGNGGPVLLILAVMSITAMTIVLAKLWQFTWLRLNAREPVETALTCWYHNDPDAALAALGESRQPSARLVGLAISGLQKAPAQSGAGLELLREELTRVASAQLEQLRGWLRALEVIATLSPLLGLLGTVLGMIEAFRQLASAGSQVDPALLSGGIWQALLTTAAGLSVAIPVVLLHSWLERRVERCAHRMEDALTRIFTRPLSRPVDEASTPAPLPTTTAHSEANIEQARTVASSQA